MNKIYTECEAGQTLSVSVHLSHSGSTPQEPGTNTKTQNLYLMIWWLVQMKRYSTNQLWPPKSVSDVRLFYHFVDLKRNLVGICNHWQYMYKHEFQNRSSKKKIIIPVPVIIMRQQFIFLPWNKKSWSDFTKFINKKIKNFFRSSFQWTTFDPCYIYSTLYSQSVNSSAG